MGTNPLMPFKVLIVDDSAFYRRRVREIIEQDSMLTVVAEANNGEVAIAKVTEFKPDVITMDVEMPVMDGITAVRKIMQSTPTPILMFSSITHDGAQATLDALDAGALDFLPKNFVDIAKDRRDATTVLRAKVKSIAGRKINKTALLPSNRLTSPGNTASTKKFFRSTSILSGGKATSAPPTDTVSYTRSSGKTYKVLAIGSSTGGPVALQKVLQPLPANFPYPILLVQHMPGTFTAAFAERLNGMCKIKIHEAQHKDILKPGHAYLAPGGKQMLIEGTSVAARIKIVDEIQDANHTYKPSVDLTFKSIAKVYNADVLGIILTGMGADGKEGCQILKQKGARIWAQDEATSVVYGMPQAVASANIAERSIPIDSISSSLLNEMKG